MPHRLTSPIPAPGQVGSGTAAASIFLDVLNVFLFFLQIFSRQE